MAVIMMMSGNSAAVSLLKIKIFWNKGYNIIISVRNNTNKNLSRDSNYIIDVIMWPKFGKFREVFKGWSWFKFNTLGLA